MITAVRTMARAPPMLMAQRDADVFRSYVRQVLVPELTPGDVVVRDNLQPYKPQDVREMIEAAGAAVLYLPPYAAGLPPDREHVEQREAAPSGPPPPRGGKRRCCRPSSRRYERSASTAASVGFSRHCGYLAA